MIRIDAPLALDDVVRVADGEDVRLDPDARTAVVLAAAAADAVAARRPVYGRTTGVGANRSTPAHGDDAHALRLLRSHAVDAGPQLPARTVRAMLAVRAGQLAAAGSGIEPVVLDGLVEMLHADALPQVRRLGSIGTADLAALAGTGLTLLGERPASRPLAPLPSIGAASALALMSSSALTLGRACLVLHDASALLDAHLRVVALVAVALQANPEAWSPAAAAATTVPQVGHVAARLRELTGPDLPAPARIQDPYGLRVAPIVAGSLLAALDAARGRVEALLGVAAENPLVTDGDVVHHGAFYQADLGQRLDAVRLALAQVADLDLARLTHLHDPALTGLPAFLAVGPAGSSGHMMVEYLAADSAQTVRLAAAPASLGSAVLSRGVEETAPFTAHGLDAAERALDAWATLLACELVSARRALRLAGRPVAGPLAALAADPDGTDDDHDLRATLDAAAAVLAGPGSVQGRR